MEDDLITPPPRRWNFSLGFNVAHLKNNNFSFVVRNKKKLGCLCILCANLSTRTSKKGLASRNSIKPSFADIVTSKLSKGKHQVDKPLVFKRLFYGNAMVIEPQPQIHMIGQLIQEVANIIEHQHHMQVVKIQRYPLTPCIVQLPSVLARDVRMASYPHYRDRVLGRVLVKARYKSANDVPTRLPDIFCLEMKISCPFGKCCHRHIPSKMHINKRTTRMKMPCRT
uniref:DUF7597 domain-containing protein n=1 Tax=Oryza punctata TaxID=4537 RepID=A0A0E0LJF4_ORYPU